MIKNKADCEAIILKMEKGEEFNFKSNNNSSINYIDVCVFQKSQNVFLVYKTSGESSYKYVMNRIQVSTFLWSNRKNINRKKESELR